MAHIRLSALLCNSPRICSVRLSTSAAVTQATSPKNKLDVHLLSRSKNEPSLITYDAPSQPSENLTRRSARSPNSLTDYYNARRRVASHPSRQVRSSTSNSVTPSGTSPLNSLPHPENVHARIFDSPSKPREYYARPQPKRDLPELRVSATSYTGGQLSNIFIFYCIFSLACLSLPYWWHWACQRGALLFSMLRTWSGSRAPSSGNYLSICGQMRRLGRC